MKEWWTAFWQLLFPQPSCCYICKQPFRREHFRQVAYRATAGRGSLREPYLYQLDACLADTLCSACLDEIQWITDSYCRTCGRAIDRPNDNLEKIYGTLTLSGQESAIEQCRDCFGGSKRNFLHSRSAAVYDGTVREIIHQFKYRGQRHMGELLADVMLLTYIRHYELLAIDLLVPVPLHSERLAERGFNQSLYLCRSIAEKKRIPIADILVRTHATHKQSKKAKWERTHSLVGAFQCMQEERAHGKRILLIDDIYTTGATVDACADVLYSAGATAVYVLTVAR